MTDSQDSSIDIGEMIEIGKKEEATPKGGEGTAAETPPGTWGGDTSAQGPTMDTGGRPQPPTASAPAQPEEPPSTGPGAPGKKGKKKLLVVGAAVLIALGALGGFWVLNYLNTSVSDVVVSHTEGDDDLIVGIHLSTTGGDYQGPAVVEIYYLGDDGWERVYNGHETMMRNEGTHLVPYTYFIVGNGKYMINATVRGITGSDTYELKSLVENLTIASASPDNPDGGTTFTATLLLLSEDGTYPDISVSEIRASINISAYRDNNLIETKTMTTITSLQIPVTFNYPTTGKTSGWYRFEATLTNHRAKPSSEMHTVDAEGEFYLNRNPQVHVTWTPTDIEKNTQVTFDATGTIDPDGDTITNYTWNVYYDPTKTPDTDNSTLIVKTGWGQTFTYNFPFTGYYIVDLMVTDDAGLDMYDMTQPPDDEGHPVEGQDGVKDTYVGVGQYELPVYIPPV